MKEDKGKESDVDQTEVKSESTEKNTKIKAKSHKKLLVVLLILFGIFIFTPLMIAGWFGFIPGLSNVLGAKTPVDLGVVWTEADYQSYLEKTGTDYLDYSEAPPNPENPDKKTIFADPISVTDQTFTQEELTAAINSVGWAWMPISNAQVKLSENTVEISGNLELDNIEKFVSFIGGVGYDESSVQTAADWGRRFANGAPVYLKANASVTNDALDFSLQEVKVGRFSVPQDIASKAVFSGSSNSINNAQNFSAKSVNIENGSLQFTGTYPQTVYVLK